MTGPPAELPSESAEQAAEVPLDSLIDEPPAAAVPPRAANGAEHTPPPGSHRPGLAR